MAGETDRTIRVFVSSTFRDMQDEREELVKRIFPQLRKMCEDRGVTWGEVDLRWGIPDEQKAEGKVLPICLAEIERCRRKAASARPPPPGRCNPSLRCWRSSALRPATTPRCLACR